MGVGFRSGRIMVASAWIASFLLMLMVFPSKCLSSCPCVKTVTDSPGLEGIYHFLEESDPMDTLCFDQCIYYREGTPKSDEYCFKEVSESEAAEVIDDEECPVTGVTGTTAHPLHQKRNTLDQTQTDLLTKYEASVTFSDNIDAVEANLVSLTASGRMKREETGKNRKKRALSVPSDCATVVSYTQNIQLTGSSTAGDLVMASQYMEPLAQFDVAEIKANNPCTVAEEAQLTTMKDNIANIRTYVEAITLSIKIEICELISLVTDLNSLLQDEGFETITLVLPTCDVSTEAPEITLQTQFTTTPPYNE